jgi:predicted ester cyclase
MAKLMMLAGQFGIDIHGPLPVHFAGLEFNLASGGKFVEHRSMFDHAALLRQIGSLPASRFSRQQE